MMRFAVEEHVKGKGQTVNFILEIFLFQSCILFLFVRIMAFGCAVNLYFEHLLTSLIDPVSSERVVPLEGLNMVTSWRYNAMKMSILCWNTRKLQKHSASISIIFIDYIFKVYRFYLLSMVLV